MNEIVIEINKETGEYVILSSTGAGINTQIQNIEVSNDKITIKVISMKNPSVP